METVHGSLSFASLPRPRTRLIGREAEREAVRTFMLDEAVALLTLTGPGGVGKTQMALAVASDLTRDFSGGVCFVDLAPVGEPAQGVAALALTLGVRPRRDRDLTAGVVAHLRPAQALLVIDNCEPLPDALDPLVATLPAGCPALQILATSQAPRLSARNNSRRFRRSRRRIVTRSGFTLDATGNISVREAVENCNERVQKLNLLPP